MQSNNSVNTGTTIECYRSKNIIVHVIDRDNSRRKIMNISFSNRDGTLFLHFPYFMDTTGLLAVVEVPGNGQHENQVNLQETGKTTSHNVKYSHHPDGKAHFSQDGKIYTTIRKHSVPLSDVTGHLFTVMGQGLHRYFAASGSSVNPRNRIDLNFDLRNEEVQAFKIFGHLYHVSKLRIGNKLGDGAVPERLGPIVELENVRGEFTNGFAIGNTYPALDKMILLLFCQVVPRVAKDKEAMMLFLGGFDRPEIATNANMATSYLALSYPTENIEELSRRIGSADYRPQTDSGALGREKAKITRYTTRLRDEYRPPSRGEIRALCTPIT